MASLIKSVRNKCYSGDRLVRDQSWAFRMECVVIYVFLIKLKRNSIFRKKCCMVDNCAVNGTKMQIAY